jgi:DNA-binding NarL/FixJ family response regulator
MDVASCRLQNVEKRQRRRSDTGSRGTTQGITSDNSPGRRRRTSMAALHTNAAMQPPPSRVHDVLVDHDTPLVVAGALDTLRRHADMRVHLPGEAPPVVDVVIADYASGMKLLSRGAPRLGPAPKVLLLTMHAREREVRLALERGAHGYLMLNCPIEALAEAVRMLGRGQRCICAEAAERMADIMAQETLTPRELDVLQLLASGRSNKAIGNELGLAVGTIKAHVKAILVKLGARSRTEAISICHRRGLTEGPALSANGARPPQRLGLSG